LTVKETLGPLPAFSTLSFVIKTKSNISSKPDKGLGEMTPVISKVIFLFQLTSQCLVSYLLQSVLQGGKPALEILLQTGFIEQKL
jgi:hypothetical protein